MSLELIFTSVPRGLKAGTRGFCTVAFTEGMPANYVQIAESLSGYRHIFALQSEDYGRNPVAYSHYLVSTGGEQVSVLSRVAACPADYSGRTNKIAHHVFVDRDEKKRAGPSWLMMQPGVFATQWDGEPHLIKSLKRLPAGGGDAEFQAAAWQAACGDAGWAGVLAQAYRDAPHRPAYLIYEPGADMLPLIHEALRLLPPSARWSLTFNTYFAVAPRNSTCLWRCCPADSPALREMRMARDSFSIDLTRPLGPVPREGDLAQCARTGAQPVWPAGSGETMIRQRPAAAPSGEVTLDRRPVALRETRRGGGRKLGLRPSASLPPVSGETHWPQPRQRKPWPLVAAAASAAALFALLLGGALVYLLKADVRRERPAPQPEVETPTAETRTDAAGRTAGSPPPDAAAAAAQPAPEHAPAPTVETRADAADGTAGSPPPDAAAAVAQTEPAAPPAPPLPPPVKWLKVVAAASASTAPLKLDLELGPAWDKTEILFLGVANGVSLQVDRKRNATMEVLKSVTCSTAGISATVVSNGVELAETAGVIAEGAVAAMWITNATPVLVSLRPIRLEGITPAETEDGYRFQFPTRQLGPAQLLAALDPASLVCDLDFGEGLPKKDLPCARTVQEPWLVVDVRVGKAEKDAIRAEIGSKAREARLGKLKGGVDGARDRLKDFVAAYTRESGTPSPEREKCLDGVGEAIVAEVVKAVAPVAKSLEEKQRVLEQKKEQRQASTPTVRAGLNDKLGRLRQQIEEKRKPVGVLEGKIKDGEKTIAGWNERIKNAESQKLKADSLKKDVADKESDLKEYKDKLAQEKKRLAEDKELTELEASEKETASKLKGLGDWRKLAEEAATLERELAAMEWKKKDLETRVSGFRKLLETRERSKMFSAALMRDSASQIGNDMAEAVAKSPAIEALAALPRPGEGVSETGHPLPARFDLRSREQPEAVLIKVTTVKKAGVQ